MSEVLNRFDIFLKISEEVKQNIKIFHVFDDDNGYNVLFITSDDKVFGFGSNAFGCCGLGHNSVVNEPQLIPQFCHKNIKQFLIGGTFVLALSSDNYLYGWGSNELGQLAKGYSSDDNIFLKPYQVNTLPSEIVSEISCGYAHCLTLDSGGKVYGWGCNTYGQVGCGILKGQIINEAVKLDFFNHISIKIIHCSYNRSYALTSDGLVYSWGINEWCDLGHNIGKDECIFEPKLINITNVISVCLQTNNTYFLTKEGRIYFCGLQNDKDCFQKTPKIINIQNDINTLYSVPFYQQGYAISIAVCDCSIFKLYMEKIWKLENMTVFDFYCDEYKLTYKTIEINEGHTHQETLKDFSDSAGNSHIRSFSNEFSVLQELGKGAFGIVYKVQNVDNSKIFAIKKIIIKETNESDTILQTYQREVNTLIKCSGDYVVQYFDSWIENNNYLYIQMEFFSDNLKNIIEMKPDSFGRKINEPMDIFEYFISCEIFRDVLECVQFLHGLTPPVIHRDIKPANILFNKHSNNGKYFKICDFGLATFDGIVTTSHTIGQGTPKYMSPEVNKGRRYNIKADIYSLGVFAQEIFDLDISSSDNNIAKNEDLNSKWRKLEELITKMIHYKYNRRPACNEIIQNSIEWAVSALELKSLNSTLKQKINENFSNYLQEKICTQFLGNYSTP